MLVWLKIHYLEVPIRIGKYIVTLSLLLNSLLGNNDFYQAKVHSENNTKFVPVKYKVETQPNVFPHILWF